MNIVSLVPSLTEMVCDFGLSRSLVGCTQFCTHPPGLLSHAQRIGGPKDPCIETIRRLKPEKILVNLEENKPAHIEELSGICEVLKTFPVSPQDVPSMIRDAGLYLNVKTQGEQMARRLESVLAMCKPEKMKPERKNRSFIYFIWTNPWMVASRDTYISRMLEFFGWENVIDDEIRYPEITIQKMKDLDPDLLIFSTEPWPFRKRDLKRLRQGWSNAPESVLADGRLFSWYGSVTERACLELNKWFNGHPGTIIRPFSE